MPIKSLLCNTEDGSKSPVISYIQLGIALTWNMILNEIQCVY